VKTVQYVVRVSREKVQDKRRLGSTRKTETRKEESVRRMWEWNGGSSTGDGKTERMNGEGKEEGSGMGSDMGANQATVARGREESTRLSGYNRRFVG